MIQVHKIDDIISIDLEEKDNFSRYISTENLINKEDFRIEFENF